MRKLKVILFIIVVIGITALVWFSNKQVEKEDIENERETAYLEYVGTADQLHMELDESKYEQTKNPDDLVLVPREFTYDFLERWKAITDIFPEIKYPTNDIKNENWLEVSDIFTSNWVTMEDVSEKIGEKMADDYDEPINTGVIQSYISYNEMSTNYFEAFLEEKGILKVD